MPTPTSNAALYLLYILNAITIIIIVFFRRKTSVSTLAWIFAVLLLPGLGIFLYFVIGNGLHFRREKTFGAKRLYDEGYYSYLLNILNLPKISHQEYIDPAAQNNEDLLRMNHQYGDSFYSQDNDIDIFTEGNTKMAALFADIEAAADHIHLLYYIFRDDNIGHKLRDLLIKKAGQGVQVRLIYDSWGSLKTSKQFFLPLLRAGAQVHPFFPSLLPYFNMRANYRNHRKIVVIDGKTGYLGGMNIGDEYLSLGKIKPWRDTHIRIRGSAVYLLQARFLMDWVYASNAKERPWREEFFPDISPPPGVLGMQIVSSGPDNQATQVRNAFIKIIQRAQRSICIQTPYFVPDETLLESLKIAAMSGIKITIILPKVYDKYFVWCAGNYYLGQLLDYGVDFYYYPGFMHAKMIIMDEQIASIGTTNIDIRSFLLGFEINAFVYSQEFAKRCLAIFEEDLSHSQYISYQLYQSRPWQQKLLEPLLRLFSPLL
ncbi:MAG: cardiolipin synthase [Clostridiales bacterium]|jgi:cardiolipin synthase|nr:cardiolipin synthase [Clostridiales bacterium]